MKFGEYLKIVERQQFAPVTGDVVVFEINNVNAISASVVEHTDSTITVDLDEKSWKKMDGMGLLSEGQRQKMAEFVLTFERDGEQMHRTFMHQPPMESAGITQDFVRNIAKSNPMHETMVEQGYKLRKAEAKLVETDQLPESDVTVIARNPTATEARVTFECHYRKTTSARTRMFVESYDCSRKSKQANYWSLPVKTGN
jgi:hypothetical protein